MDDESGELMELMEEVPLKELGDAKLERLVRGKFENDVCGLISDQWQAAHGSRLV